MGDKTEAAGTTLLQQKTSIVRIQALTWIKRVDHLEKIFAIPSVFRRLEQPAQRTVRNAFWSFKFLEFVILKPGTMEKGAAPKSGSYIHSPFQSIS